MKCCGASALLEAQPGRDKRGGALVAALLMVVVVSVLGASFLQLSTSITQRREHANDTKQAMYLAEAGLAEAYSGMGLAKTGNVGSDHSSAGFGDGLFWVEATDLGAGRRQLQSTGMWGAGRATLGLVAELVETRVGESGLFVVSGIAVDEASFFDSYDSSRGSYADQLASGSNNDRGHVGSNAAINVDGDEDGTLVRGDVTPGVGFSVSTQGTLSITGSSTPRAAATTLPAVEEPEITLLPAYEHDDGLPLVLAAGDSGYESLRMKQDTQLYMMGPARLRTGSLRIDAGAEVIFDVSGGPIDVY